ncbi:MAG: dTDP-4-dehydrorhamnose reductase [uncultured Segetibacter sp.]|uniref:dTDP-4-dehydrorhamnose reductase n=1 Tax=uncultured Segetibacter sp. TaxID=481133 RepID=A0A6J4S399_9BACT|nr:MAG: dTDP-4-dehydrorhamnose reductase [uncultured Segetibacter sp.]
MFTDVAELDITNAEKVAAYFDRYKPAICINAAAYTAVDKAETERELALKINADAVGNLADNCNKMNTTFIHISTDYIFDGTATTPYGEDHPVNPVNFYGESKRKGEEIALEKHPSAIVLRTSWVYSFFGNNFVKTMLRLMKERESINVVNDQFGSPTYAADLAAAIMHIASRAKDKGGIYHFSNEGVISWFDFAVAIRELSGLSCIVKPMGTSGYPTSAKRPAYSVMNKEKIRSTFGIELRDWKDSLKQCIQLLQ